MLSLVKKESDSGSRRSDTSMARGRSLGRARGARRGGSNSQERGSAPGSPVRLLMELEAANAAASGSTCVFVWNFWN